MTDQQQIPLDVPAEPPKLTARQQHALELVQKAGREGVDAGEVGAALCARVGRHGAGERCVNDARNGNQVLRSLRSKGLVKYRLRQGWVATGAALRDAPMPAGMTDVVPF